MRHRRVHRKRPPTAANSPTTPGSVVDSQASITGSYRISTRSSPNQTAHEKPSLPFGQRGFCSSTGRRTRTPNLLIWNQLLYQLSYARSGVLWPVPGLVSGGTRVAGRRRRPEFYGRSSAAGGVGGRRVSGVGRGPVPSRGLYAVIVHRSVESAKLRDRVRDAGRVGRANRVRDADGLRSPDRLLEACRFVRDPPKPRHAIGFARRIGVTRRIGFARRSHIGSEWVLIRAPRAGTQDLPKACPPPNEARRGAARRLRTFRLQPPEAADYQLRPRPDRFARSPVVGHARTRLGTPRNISGFVRRQGLRLQSPSRSGSPPAPSARSPVAMRPRSVSGCSPHRRRGGLAASLASGGVIQRCPPRLGNAADTACRRQRDPASAVRPR